MKSQPPVGKHHSLLVLRLYIISFSWGTGNPAWGLLCFCLFSRQIPDQWCQTNL